jgi:ring-1,2-phenylacetyl-CoA epoxidase subunit PaaE
VSDTYYPLKVADTRREIGGDALTISFEVPEQWAPEFAWQAGQFLTLRLFITGEEVRRCYTISASPHSGYPLRITVKRTPSGLVSNHLNDHIKAGDTIEALPPQGKFSLCPGETLHRTHYFLGAGSGITPLYAMLHSVLLAEPHSSAYLLYANRDHRSIIFQGELGTLQQQHPERFTVSHVLSSPSLWSSFQAWRSGRIDAAALDEFFQTYPPYAQDAQYYLCGPGSMNRDLRQALQQLDVPANRIHSESFGGASDSDETVTGMPASATVTLQGHKQEISLAAGQTVLEATRQAGLSPSFSCESGICGSCRAHLRKGTVHMSSHPALDEDELKQGIILTCQAQATCDRLVVNYDA